MSQDETTRSALLAPAIREAIERSDAPTQRRIAAAVAAGAVAAAPGLSDVIRSAAAALVAGHLDRGTARLVASEADRLDARYLELHDDEKPGGQTEGWESAFRLARAAAAVRYGFDPSAERAAVEATYEATFALGEDHDQIASIVRSVT